jgi:predicted transposase YbfD/YdcC
LRRQAQAFLAARQSPQERLCNLDGKTLRGTIAAEGTQGTHLLAIQQAGTNLVLAQVPVGEKKNEISAGPGLLKTVDLSGKIVSGDAMHTQRDLSRQIVQAGGDYLWFVKRNQPALCQKLVAAFASPASEPADAVTVTEYDKGHGRLEERQLTTSAQVTNTLDWPYAAQGFVLHRTRTLCRSGKVTKQTVYGITSLEPMEIPPTTLLDLTRQHWNIENGLHYRRDVTFKEDRCRQKSAEAAECLAIFNNLAIGLLRWLGWDNLARARRYYGAHLTEALQVIQGACP